jgi:serine/threonine-protein kinase HipA
MQTLKVYYCGWGEDWHLGTAADDGKTLLFEYSAAALQRGLELSPRHLKLRAQSYSDFPIFMQRLPGLLADALPDGWGLLLMDRFFRQQKRQPKPLERLAFLGNRTMGALRFEPADNDWQARNLPLLALAEASQRILAGQAADVLKDLVVTGGSPQGARPKVLVQYDATSGNISTSSSAAGEPWLIKFQTSGEHKEVCAIEHLYAQLAKTCGIEMPDTRYFDLSDQLAGFGIARFDRENGMRVPIHSLAGLLHTDFRLPATDYTTWLRATRLITRDQREVNKAYRRAIFNVIFHNRDDHAKNFAWRLGRDQLWHVAPGFDLTFSDGPGGQHYSDICGEGQAVTRTHLMRLAQEGDIDKKVAQSIIDELVEKAALMTELAKDLPIRRATIQQINRTVKQCRQTIG